MRQNYLYVTPGYTAGDVANARALSFGAGIALGAWAGSDWGWNAWGWNWHSGIMTFLAGADGIVYQAGFLL